MKNHTLLCLPKISLVTLAALLSVSFLSAAPSSQKNDEASTGRATPAGEVSTLQFTSAEHNSSESGGGVTLTVSRVGRAGAVVSVDYSTSDGSASSGADYSSKNGTLTWESGDTADKTFTITLFDDSVFEGAEDFSVTLSNPSSGATIGSPDTATVTIEDDESEPTLSISGVQAEEIDGAMGFEVTLSNASAFDVSFHYATTDGTAVAPGDYGSASDSATIFAGETSVTIFIPIIGDFINEDDEEFTVTISDAINATIALGTATGTIIDNDAPPTYTIDDVSIQEGDSGTQDLVFTVTKTGDTKFASTVQFDTADVTAFAGEDYVPTSGVVNFAANETQGTISVPILGDMLAESDETFLVRLLSSTGGRPQGEGGLLGTATGTIQNDDNAPVATTASVTSTDENMTVTITLTGTDDDDDDLTFAIVDSPDNGTLGDISTPDCSSFNVCTATVDYTPNDGFAGSDSFTYTVSDGANTSSEATVSITVNEIVPVVTNLEDSGPGSLRQALADAEDGETINFLLGKNPNTPAGGAVITLTSGELLIDKEVFINGLGANILTVQRDPNSSAFRDLPCQHELPLRPGLGLNPRATSSARGVTIQGLTISNGLGARLVSKSKHRRRHPEREQSVCA